MQQLGQMSDDQLLAEIERVESQMKSGFAAPRTAAPDKIAVRQEYNAALKDIQKQRQAVQGFNTTMQNLDRFGQLNRDWGTGGLGQNLPNWGWLDLSAVSDYGAPYVQKGSDGKTKVAFGKIPAYNEMKTISAGMQIGSVPQGQGAVSNFERELFSKGVPSTRNVGNVNANIREHMKATYQRENDRLAFYETYLNSNGHLNGAEAAWGGYVAKNPYTVEGKLKSGDSRIMSNPRRQPWQAYFGVATPKAAPARSAAAPAVAASRPAPRPVDPMMARTTAAARGAAPRPAARRPAAQDDFQVIRVK